jgi:hypothetical protein
MARYLVSYDLDKPGPQDYEKIITEIKRIGGVEVLFSQWVVRRDPTVTAVMLRDHLINFIDKKTDRLIVNEIDTNWATWRSMVDINTL